MFLKMFMFNNKIDNNSIVIVLSRKLSTTHRTHRRICKKKHHLSENLISATESIELIKCVQTECYAGVFFSRFHVHLNVYTISIIKWLTCIQQTSTRPHRFELTRNTTSTWRYWRQNDNTFLLLFLLHSNVHAFASSSRLCTCNAQPAYGFDKDSIHIRELIEISISLWKLYFDHRWMTNYSKVN